MQQFGGAATDCDAGLARAEPDDIGLRVGGAAAQTAFHRVRNSALDVEQTMSTPWTRTLFKRVLAEIGTDSLPKSDLHKTSLKAIHSLGWHDKHVPRLTRPTGMPEEIALVVEVMSNAVRTEILRVLAQKPLTAVEISQLTGVVHSSIHRHLVLLEDAGLVHTDHEPHRRRGREIRWTVDAQRIESMAAEWAAYASDASSPR